MQDKNEFDSFDEQLKYRLLSDEKIFEEAFAQMADAVLGNGLSAAIGDNRARAQSAIHEILGYYHAEPVELPDDISDLERQLDFLTRPSGIMRRGVELNGKWYLDAFGAYLAYKKDGGVVALLPRGIRGYSYFDYDTGRRVRVNKRTAAQLEVDAMCFYKPLPAKKIGVSDLLRYVTGSFSVSDVMQIGFFTLLATLVGMLLPRLNSILIGSVADSGSNSLLIAAAAFLVSATIANVMFSTTKAIMTQRVQAKSGLAVQSAAMMRMLSLPVDFFKKYSSGELSQRMQSISSLCGMIFELVLSIGFNVIFSLLYVTQIFAYSPSLLLPALLIIAANVAFTIATVVVRRSHSEKLMNAMAAKSGTEYALLSGLQKIKLCGAEKRAFSKWAKQYSAITKLKVDPPFLLKINTALSVIISLGGTALLYYCAASAGVSVADYYAFNCAYGMLTAALLTLSMGAQQISEIQPTLKLVQPLLEASPEVAENKRVLTRLGGSIELDHVSFRYSESSPLILDDVSLKIKAGQYIAIVGKTGCGKSTLMRLLLGFETPQKGTIYFDGKNINTIDLHSLRQKIGSVMQNGKLFRGSIYSNIVISAPWLTQEDAWAAARLASISDDIEAMPMGMNTMISEGSGGVSGGQRQRLLIARAIAPKPKILMFDEATSALDNITQKQVCESLSELRCTRLVIAHRLSTIQQCDRIIVLDEGKIIEDGSYNELVSKNGFFAELVSRQRLDDSAYIGRTTTY